MSQIYTNNKNQKSGLITILAIGKTGLGKSTYAEILCNINATASSSTRSTTTKANLYENQEFRYLDTVGFQDSLGKSDQDIFEDLMEKMRQNAVNDDFKIDLILWFTSFSIREAADLKREADFIQQLSKFSPAGNDVWKSVILITQGPLPPQNWEQGAQKAAQTAGNNTPATFNIPTFAGWILGCQPESNHDKKLGNRSQEDRYDFNVYTKQETRKKIQELSTYRNCFSVRFISKRCKKCTSIVDPRILKGPCHTLPEVVHGPKTVRCYHSEELHRYHRGGEKPYHPEKFENFEAVEKGLMTGGRMGAAAGARMGPIAVPVMALKGAILGFGAGMVYNAATCAKCKKVITSTGCAIKCTYCKNDWRELGCGEKYSCCGKKEGELGCREELLCEFCDQNYYESVGCIRRCSNCKNDWHTSVGCKPSAYHEV
jgi:hypothetical protein